MISSVLSNTALVEKVNGKTYVTIGLGLSSSTENGDICEHYRFEVVSLDYYISPIIYVLPMGRDVEFYTKLNMSNAKKGTGQYKSEMVLNKVESVVTKSPTPTKTPTTQNNQTNPPKQTATLKPTATANPTVMNSPSSNEENEEVQESIETVSPEPTISSTTTPVSDQISEEDIQEELMDVTVEEEKIEFTENEDVAIEESSEEVSNEEATTNKMPVINVISRVVIGASWVGIAVIYTIRHRRNNEKNN